MPKCGIRHTHFQPLTEPTCSSSSTCSTFSLAHTHTHTQQDRVDTLHTDTGDCRSPEETGEEPEAEDEPEACLLGGDWTVVIDDD